MFRLKLFSIVVLALTVGLSVSACTEEGGNKQETADSAEEEGVSEASINAYFSLKDALVQSDVEATARAASTLMSSLEGETAAWASPLRDHAQQIAETGELSAAREHFFNLSKGMYEALKVGKSSDAVVYQQYCPMAFNNTGAFWLAAEEEINNPYFGDMMLHCGRVEEEL